MNDDKFFATGQCLCGEIKYTVSSAPIHMAQCHCDDCRRSSGTGHASYAFCKKDDVHIEGKTSSYDSTSDTGSVITRYFCPKCGSCLFGIDSTAVNIVGVTAGTLNESDWFKADAIVYNKKKPKWDFMDESIPAFEEMPPASGK